MYRTRSRATHASQSHAHSRSRLAACSPAWAGRGSRDRERAARGAKGQRLEARRQAAAAAPALVPPAPSREAKGRRIGRTSAHGASVIICVRSPPASSDGSGAARLPVRASARPRPRWSRRRRGRAPSISAMKLSASPRRHASCIGMRRLRRARRASRRLTALRLVRQQIAAVHPNVLLAQVEREQVRHAVMRRVVQQNVHLQPVGEGRRHRPRAPRAAAAAARRRRPRCRPLPNLARRGPPPQRLPPSPRRPRSPPPPPPRPPAAAAGALPAWQRQPIGKGEMKLKGVAHDHLLLEAERARRALRRRALRNATLAPGR